MMFFFVVSNGAFLIPEHLCCSFKYYYLRVYTNNNFFLNVFYFDYTQKSDDCRI